MSTTWTSDRRSPWLVAGILVVVIILGVVVMTIAMASYWGWGPGSSGGYGYMMGGYGGGAGWWALMVIPMVVGAILFVILLVVLLAPGWSSTVTVLPMPTGTPGEVLDARYARGEIGRDQYLRMKEDLRAPPH